MVQNFYHNQERIHYLLKNFTHKNFFFQKDIEIYHPKPSHNKNLKKVFLYSVGQSVMLLKNKCYFILFISILKNFLSLIIRPKKFKIIYFFGKLYGFFYHFFS